MMYEEVDYEFLDEVLSTYHYDKRNIIAILQATQKEYRYLPRPIFPYFAGKLDMSTAKIYSVATFYENFSLEPKGKHIIHVCNGTACHVRKSIPVIERLHKELKLSPGKVTTDDMMFTLETVSCLGACGLAPALNLDGKVYAAMTPEKASKLIQSIREEDEHAGK